MEPARDKPPRLPTRSSSALMGTTMPRRPFEGGSGFPLSSSSSSSSPFMEFGAPSASKSRPSSSVEPKIEQASSPVGEKLPSSSSSSPGVAAPRPLEALQSAPIPPFLSKTYELVDDPSLDPLISWGSTGRSFVVWDPVEFARAVLPRNFKHSNFSSFVRQLNTYGFHKIDADRWEFANEDFLRGNKPLLKNINRRRSSQVQQVGSQVGFSAENAKPELEGELHMLRKEKSALMQEAITLRQEHLMTVQQVDALNQRMQLAEQRQKLMVSFLAKVLQHPVLLAHLKQLKEQREIASTIRRKFLKQQQHSHSDLDKSMDQQTGKKRLEFTGATSSGLQGIECSVSKQLPNNLLQDMVEKPDLDTSRGELLIGSVETGLEVLDPLFLDPDSVAIKVGLPESSHTDMGFSGTEFFASFPEDTTPERMFSDAIIPATEFARPDPKTVSFEGKNVVDKTEVTSAGGKCLISFAEDTSQEKMFSDAIASARKTSSGPEEIWNLCLEAGESSWSSRHWDSLAQDAIELEAGARPDALWDIDLQALDEDLEFDKCLGSYFCHQERENQAGAANKDHKEKMEP
uniref:Heat stress transcription factor A-3-like n=1 Tax=Elaeis guineensis var. tenera TaxID=51953 RepID=A0A6I9SBX5_ELAGV|nr:heat stress transcription factor A-3-like [Elaeis guineensis]